MSIATLKKRIENDFGAGSLLTLTDQSRQKVDVVTTGSIRLDSALGIGGIPLGRIVEIYGPESSGKTTLVQHIIANAQSRGLVCGFIDAEQSFDPNYAEVVGVDVDTLLFSQPNCAEEALEICSRLVDSGEVSVVVVDSVAALTPRAELEGEMGQQQVGLQARIMGQAMRKLVGPASRNKCAIVFTNQLREKVGVIYGSPETQPGGRALKFNATIRLDVRRIATNKKGNEAVSNRTRVKVVKNKIAPPYKTAEFDIVFGEGIDGLQELLDVGVEQGIISKSGAWYTIKGEKAQGQKAREALKKKPALQDKIRSCVLATKN